MPLLSWVILYVLANAARCYYGYFLPLGSCRSLLWLMFYIWAHVAAITGNYLRWAPVAAVMGNQLRLGSCRCYYRYVLTFGLMPLLLWVIIYVWAHVAAIIGIF